MSQKDIDAGEQCMTCGGHIFTLRPPGYRRECHSCKDLGASTDEVSHKSKIRCPKCRETWDAWETDYDIFGEGEHDVTCPECEHEFEITTYVTHTFKSPAIVEGED
jgi:DNA-directed RNA polymerase subunit RPC12/RpoP